MAAEVIVENVSKKYSRNAQTHLGYGVRDLFDEVFGRTRKETLRKDEFWAVRDISLHLKKGDSLALLGRNGSGKTTLLKMLHGLIKPDAGRIVMEGTVQALINLQSGFNSDLSGKDNVYNMASLLGMGRRETDAILEDVIRFSELEAFMGSPVGTYSSGMKARLGFSVAVSLQPDILLIDEVLAVGDHAFQNKCHHRMQQLKKAGVILIFVTHSHTQALQLCEKALWMHEGAIRASGPTKAALEEYLAFLESQESQKPINPSGGTDQRAKKAHVQNQFFGAIHNGEDHIDNLQVELVAEDENKDAFPIHSAVDIRYSFALKGEVENLNVSLSIYRNDGVLISTISTLKNEVLKQVRGGWVKCCVRIKDMDITPEQYVLVMSIHQGHSYLFRDVVRQFTVLGNGDVFWGMKEFDIDYTLEESGDMQYG